MSNDLVMVFLLRYSISNSRNIYLWWWWCIIEAWIMPTFV